jgi:hypothetical protein
VVYRAQQLGCAHSLGGYMPNVVEFYLKPRAKRKQKPMDYCTLDAEICDFMGVPVDQTEWSFNWYNRIAFSFALGCSEERIRELYKDHPETLRILDFLMDKYEVEAYCAR